jgi:hypothetical protein
MFSSLILDRSFSNRLHVASADAASALAADDEDGFCVDKEGKE